MTDRFAIHGDKPAMIWREQEFSYRWFIEHIALARARIAQEGIAPSSVVVLHGDFSPYSAALLFALIEIDAIIVPISTVVKQYKEFCEIAEAEYILELQDDIVVVSRTALSATHPILLEMKGRRRPGLALFSSGTTGTSKAAIHDFSLLLRKFYKTREPFRAIAFLLFDHIGGINTLLSILANCGLLIVPGERTPDAICRAIEHYRVELLPTSPTFLNMILIGKSYTRYDLSSLRLVTYGTEAMPEHTLKMLHALFPAIRFKQTYGLSEIGIMRSLSRSDESLWIKIGGEDYATRVVNGELWIKATCAMLGYLNAPSPFDTEGWFNTQDKVEVDGEWLKILGRDTDLINVGGQKVYPCEVESVLMELDNIVDASVYRVNNPLLGQVVAARVMLASDEPLPVLKKRIRLHCRHRMDGYKIPMVVEIVNNIAVSERGKRIR